MDFSNGAVFVVYYDAVSKRSAEESIPTLAAFYREIATITAVDAGKVNWFSVVFTTTEKYVPPRSGSEVRWKVLVNETGKLGIQGVKDLFETIPHEQTHSVELTFIPSSPRWFSEGLATWVGLMVTEQWNPQLARSMREQYKNERAKLTAPLNLSGWGGVIVKREAILRQVTPEVRARMEKDPTFMPPGPFSFQEGDAISDESNTIARYDGARELFDELDKRAGRKRLRSWLKSVWELGAALNTNEITFQIREQLNVKIMESLR